MNNNVNGINEVSQEQNFNAVISAVVADLAQKVGQCSYDKAVLQVENQLLKQQIAGIQQQLTEVQRPLEEASAK